MRLDAHQHFWHPARGDYGWMPPDDPVLTRPYGPADLAPFLASGRIDRTILVQAAPTVHETEYLLGIADTTPTVAGVVGWIDFEAPDDRAHLDRLARHPAFRGVRPMVQDIADDDWLLRDDIQWAFRAITDADLTFDALGFPRHLANFLTIFTRYPDMRVVVDHCMKPQIHAHADDTFAQWATGMTRIAAETAACCKLSGLVTEASDDWTADDLRPYVDHILDTFGPDRVMWGSDWPVCRLRAEHDDWLRTADTLVAGCTPEDRARIFGGTAAAFYRVTEETA